MHWKDNNTVVLCDCHYNRMGRTLDRLNEVETLIRRLDEILQRGEKRERNGCFCEGMWMMG